MHNAVSAVSSSLRPVYQYAREGVRGLAGGGRVGGEGVVLLVRGSELDPVARGSSGPATGATAAAACGGGTATPGCGRPVVVRGGSESVGLWGKSSGLLARGVLLLARWIGGVPCLGPGDQVSNEVTETHGGNLLQFVEWAAKPSPHAWAARVGGLLSGGQEAEDRPEATGSSQLAAMSCHSLKRQLCAQHSVDKPLPRSSLRLRGLVMALEDGARVGDCNNGC
jgi:hypothetical protein